MKKTTAKPGNWLHGDLIATVLTAGFGFIYEQFSHGVYSVKMIYAFAVPLVLGVLPLFWMIRHGKTASEETLLCWHCGLAAWTVGLLFCGALEIYGTDNRLAVVYWLAGALLMACAFAGYLRGMALVAGKAGSGGT